MFIKLLVKSIINFRKRDHVGKKETKQTDRREDHCYSADFDSGSVSVAATVDAKIYGGRGGRRYDTGVL